MSCAAARCRFQCVDMSHGRLDASRRNRARLGGGNEINEVGPKSTEVASNQENIGKTNGISMTNEHRRGQVTNSRDE